MRQCLWVCVFAGACVYIYEVEPASNKVYLDFFWKKNQGIPECVFVCVCACVWILKKLIFFVFFFVTMVYDSDF